MLNHPQPIRSDYRQQVDCPGFDLLHDPGVYSFYSEFDRRLHFPEYLRQQRPGSLQFASQDALCLRPKAGADSAIRTLLRQ